MLFPSDRRYTREHEWIRVDGDRGIVGITSFAQDQLGDVVFVELPSVGSKVVHDKTFGVVESVKTASDLFAPVDGTVAAVNEKLKDSPDLVNSDPYGEGWMIAVTLSDPNQPQSLLTSTEYEAILPK